jgi:hypothetical protein
MSAMSHDGTMSFDAMKQAFARSDAAALTAMYDDRAVIDIINKDNPPKHPRSISGRSAIEAYFKDLCARPLTHDIRDDVVAGDHAAFLEECTYPDGMRVMSASTLEMKGGHVMHQTIVEAWDPE